MPSLNDGRIPSPSENEQIRVDGAEEEEEALDAASSRSSLSEIKGEEDLKPTNRLKRLSKKTKEKTKKLLDKDARKKESGPVTEAEEAVDRINRDPGFNPEGTSQRHKRNEQHRAPNGNALKQTRDVVKAIGQTVVHPKEQVKQSVTKRTAGHISTLEHPILSRREDLEFLQVQDLQAQLESAEHISSSSSSIVGGYAVTPDTKAKADKLEQRRESIRTAWMTSRHVSRVRVTPKRKWPYPTKDSFRQYDEKGSFVRYQWENWLGYMLIYYSQDFSLHYVDDVETLPFDLEAVRRHVERLVIVSAPWQTWFMQMRRVYRWEDPVLTGKWLTLFLVLWHTQHVMGFVFLYICYVVLWNKIYPSSVSSLRSSMQRSLDRSMTAYHFGELIEKHGREDWLKPVMEEVGPFIQLQLGDLANMLEMLSNFYAWKSPRKTAGSVFFFFTCLLATLLTDMEYCMKIVWFIVGGTFFFCWPISSLYPKYRYLVSPFRWVMWDIPTNAEWSFQYLRRNAQISREKMISQKIQDTYDSHNPTPLLTVQDASSDSPSPFASSTSISSYETASSTGSILEEADILTFRGESQGTPGRLCVYSDGVRFVRSMPTRKELWRRGWLEMVEMRKRSSQHLPRALALDQQLEMVFTHGQTVRVGALEKRDEAFNSIIGFSGLQWQVGT